MSTNNEGTPTPLTDAATHVMDCEDGFHFLSPSKHGHWVNADFARQLLERPLTATKQRLEVCEKALKDISEEKYNNCSHQVMRDIARAALHPSADKAESKEDQP